MTALSQAISRIFHPEPGQEAVIVRKSAERLEMAAQELADHHDVFADLVRNVQNDSRGGRSSKRARGR